MDEEMGKRRDSSLESRRTSPASQNDTALAGAVRLDETERSKLAAVFGTHLVHRGGREWKTNNWCN